MRSTLFTLFSIIVIDLIGFGIVIPVLPFYAESFGASATVLGALLTSYAAMQFIFAPLWGRLSDRIGRRPVMLITIAGASGALLILGLADSLLWIFIARLLGGIFGANISVATAYVTDVTTAENRTRWMGMIGASFGIGFILGPAIGGFLAPYGYSVPMLFAAALAAINFIYGCFVLREPKKHEVRVTTPPRIPLLKNRFVLHMCGMNFLFTVAVTQLEAIFAFYMMDRFAYGARDVAYILVVMALIMAGIQGGAIRSLAKRFGEKRLLVVGVLCLAFAFAGLPWMPLISLLMIPLIVASIGRGMAQPAMLSLVSVAAQAPERGSVMGIFQSSASLGRVLGPTLAGFLYDRFFGIPFLFGSVLMFVVSVIASRLRVTSPHEVTMAEAEMSMEADGTGM